MTDYIERVDTFMRTLGLDTYRVGGSVRDNIIGRKVKDADYVIFGSDLDTIRQTLSVVGRGGIKITPMRLRTGTHVGWRVAKRGLGLIEIALPRMEVSTGPGRHDFQIVTDPNLTLEQDAERRDFTFNAIYKRIEDDQTVDPLNGITDLLSRNIRVTHPYAFRDDPLRILRALRFVSTLGYELTPDTLALMIADHEAVTGLTVKGVSGTALDELKKLLMGDNVGQALRIARDTGVLGSLLPELKPMIGFDQNSRYHDMTTDEHTFRALETAAKMGANVRVRLALLFHDSGKPESAWADAKGNLHYYSKKLPDGTITEDHEVVGRRIWRQAANRLNCGRDLREDVSVLIRSHMVPVEQKSSKAGVWVRRKRVEMGDDLLSDLLLHRMCDLTGKGSGSIVQKHLEAVGSMEAMRQEAGVLSVPSSVADLHVDGFDAMKHGLLKANIGRVLRQLLDEVVVSPDEQKLSEEWQRSRLEALANEYRVSN